MHYLLRLFFIFVYYRLIIFVFPLEIDNGVIDEPSIECSADSVAVVFKTLKPFDGRVYAKGFVDQIGCVGSGMGNQVPTLNLTFSDCGVQRTRQLSPPGITVSTTIVISFHKVFITKVDRAYRISCFYMEAAKSVTAMLDVSMITTGHVTNQMAMPVCRYEILSTTAAGLPVKYAKVGEMVYHRWICDAQDASFCMRVHSCTVDDGQGGQPFQVLDARGCSIDKYVLQDLDYSADLMAGREAHVFKFADKSTLYFNCQLEIAIKTAENPNCNATRPKCDRNMTIPQATSSSDTTTVSTNTISSENSMSAKAETTSNTVTMQPNTFNIVNLTSRISSNLPNDTIPVVVPDIFHNGTFTNFSVPFRSSMVDGTTETPNDSTNGIDRKRRDDLLMARDYPEKLGDFDLPRQQLLVLDIDDDKDHASSKNDPQSSDADSYQPSGFLPTKCDASTVNNNNNKLCLSVAVFYTFFLSLVLISLICIFFTIKACLVRRKLQRIYFLRTNNRKNVFSSSTTTSNGCGSSHADDSSLSMAS